MADLEYISDITQTQRSVWPPANLYHTGCIRVANAALGPEQTEGVDPVRSLIQLDDGSTQWRKFSYPVIIP